MLPTNCSKVEINGLAYRARRAYRPMSDAVKTKTSPLNVLLTRIQPEGPAKIVNIYDSIMRFSQIGDFQAVPER